MSTVNERFRRKLIEILARNKSRVSIDELRLTLGLSKYPTPKEVSDALERAGYRQRESELVVA